MSTHTCDPACPWQHSYHAHTPFRHFSNGWDTWGHCHHGSRLPPPRRVAAARGAVTVGTHACVLPPPTTTTGCPPCLWQQSCHAHTPPQTAPAGATQGRALPPAAAASRRHIARGVASVIGTQWECSTPTIHKSMRRSTSYMYYALEHSIASTATHAASPSCCAEKTLQQNKPVLADVAGSTKPAIPKDWWC